MPRISLVEAYNNRDVIAWLVKHQDAIDEMMNILQNINPDGDLTNIVLKTGDQTIDGVKTFIGKIVANCDIIQNGAAYETHAEQIFTKNDYIVMRDGALGGLQPGEFSGFRINRYDSVHDGHLVMDSSGVARVGDVGDEQPLATRDEAGNMTDGAIVTWDSTNVKIKAAASNVGDDDHPVKIVGGVPTPVSVGLVQNNVSNSNSTLASNLSFYLELLQKQGKTVAWSGQITTSVDIPAYTNFATLPDGFRPSVGFITALADFAGGLVAITLNTDGTVMCSGAIQTGHYYFLSTTFMTT